MGIEKERSRGRNSRNYKSHLEKRTLAGGLCSEKAGMGQRSVLETPSLVLELWFKWVVLKKQNKTRQDKK